MSGGLPEEVRRAVSVHLEVHGAASEPELERMLASRLASFRPESHRPALMWQLKQWAAAGHVHCVTVAGRRRWKYGPGPVAGRLAQARRVLRLDTSVYEPAPAAVVRAGAMDFARIPSLLLGHRTPYWRSAQ